MPSAILSVRIMKNDASPLFSLGDSFEYRPSKLNAFEELGDAPQGEYHIATFFRNVLSSVLCIDYKNPIYPNKHCALYSILGASDAVYGMLFVVNKDKFRLRDSCLIVSGVRESVGDFTLFPFTSEKPNLYLYRDSSDTLLVNIGDLTSEFVVLDE